MEILKVVSIDIGIVNLGYVYAELTFEKPTSGSKFKHLLVNSEWRNHRNYDIRILKCDRVDITNVQHRVVHFCDCTLLHERCIPDYIDHFVQEHPFLHEADIILLERQPPVGITNVQDLLFVRFRKKVKLISPNAVHSFFKLNNNYDFRKKQTEEIAKLYLSDIFQYNDNERKHDIADAMVMILYFYKTYLDNIIRTTDFCSKIIDFDKFIFKKNVC
jgi:hypothetical protein